MSAEFPFSIDLGPRDRRARLVAAAYAAASWVRARRAAWTDTPATPAPSVLAAPNAQAPTTAPTAPPPGVWTGHER